MPTYSITVAADDLPDPRPLDLLDLEAELLCRPPIVRAHLTGSPETGGIRLVATVEADDEDAAAHAASEHFARALVATRRTTSVARVESGERRAPLGPVELDGGPLDGWRVTAEGGLRRITFSGTSPSTEGADYRSGGRTTRDGVPILDHRPASAGAGAGRTSDEAMRSLVQLAHDLPDLDADEALRRLDALGPGHRDVADELVTRMELIARRHRLEAAGASIGYGRRAAAPGAADPGATCRCAVTLPDGRRFETLAAHERAARDGAYTKAEAALGIA